MYELRVASRRTWWRFCCHLPIGALAFEENCQRCGEGYVVALVKQTSALMKHLVWRLEAVSC
jgi:hypothetical protein